jgi:protein arginine kinase activator
MSCDQCREREAVIHLTQIVNDQVTTLHLCERCAAEKGVESPGAVAKTPLGTFLAAMGKEAGSEAPAPRTADTCPRCGGSLQDFRESGRLGCPECWRAFESPLRDLLHRHGVAPGPKVEVAHLREQLRAAVESENFELAAELRDRLRVLE